MIFINTFRLRKKMNRLACAVREIFRDYLGRREGRNLPECACSPERRAMRLSILPTIPRLPAGVMIYFFSDLPVQAISALRPAAALHRLFTLTHRRVASLTRVDATTLHSHNYSRQRRAHIDFALNKSHGHTKLILMTGRRALQ